MRGQFSDVAALDAPDMDESVLAAGNDVPGVGGEVALDDGGLVEEAGELEELIALEGVEEDDAVVGRGQHQVLSVWAELHYLYLVVVLPPLREGTGFAAIDPVQANPYDLLVLLLLRPRHREGHSRRIEARHGKGRHALGLHVQLEVALYRNLQFTLSLGVEVPDAHGVVVAGGEKVVVLGVDHEVGDAVGVPLEHLDDPVLVDGPIEDEVVLLGGHQNGAVVMRVRYLLDLVDFHE